MKKTDTVQGGFTAVEMLITIVIAAIFIDAFYMLFNTVTGSNYAARQQSNASNYAYWYLGTQSTAFASYPVACNATTDLSVNSSAAGDSTMVTPVTGSNALFPLPEPVVVTTTFFWPTGCGAGNNHPLLIKVGVTYGPQNRTVTHATYVN